MKQYLEGLNAVHESEHIYRGRYSDRGVSDAGKVYPTAVHPIIRTHVDTGKKSLFVNRTFTTRIEGAAGRREQGRSTILVQPRRESVVPDALQLAHERRRDVGQSLHAAHGDLGLLAERAERKSGDGERRKAGLRPATMGDRMRIGLAAALMMSSLAPIGAQVRAPGMWVDSVNAPAFQLGVSGSDADLVRVMLRAGSRIREIQASGEEVMHFGDSAAVILTMSPGGQQRLVFDRWCENAADVRRG